jgi:hypothetical protein
MSNYTVSGTDKDGDDFSLDVDTVDEAIDLAYWMDTKDFDNIDMKSN